MLRLTKLIGLAALQAVIMLAILELACRLLDPLGISYYPETARYLDTMIQEEPIGYRNRPGLQGTFYGVPVSINSHGMRDREIPPKAPEEFRILVMGDSVPFGIGVRFEDSVPRQLEQLLNENAEPRRTYRTLNMGVPSYNTEQQLIQLATVGLSLEPDMVILLFSVNDIEPKKWVFEKRSAWYADLAQRSYGVSLLFVLLRQLRSVIGHPEQLISIGEYRPDSARWQAVDQSLTQINRRCSERGIPFLIFTSLRETGGEFRMVEGVGQREGFAVANLWPWSDSRWAKEDPQDYANSLVDRHPNPAGGHVLAVMMSEYLYRVGLLNPGRRPKSEATQGEPSVGMLRWSSTL